MSPDPSSGGTDLERRLAERRSLLLDVVRKRASRSLLAMESPEDLVQDIYARVLAHGEDYEERDDVSFGAWLQTVAGNVLNDRHRHFRALKRDGARVLRLAFTESGDSDLDPVRSLAASVTGPSTYAIRREQLALASRALDTLLERDRWLIERQCLGKTTAEDAAELGLSLDSSAQARRRALERFRRAFRIVVNAR